MTKFVGLMAALVAALGVTLATPASSEAGIFHWRRGYYVEPRGSGGSFSGNYRVGNVIINGRRWGDIDYRYSHADLVRW